MNRTIKLEKRFDADRMLEEVATLESSDDWLEHWHDRYHNGGWRSIPLYSIQGVVDTDALRPGEGEYRPTPYLEQSEYLLESVDWFQCEKRRVRLMKLEGGGEISEHTDRLEWALGKVRIHVPIVTSPQVHFVVEGQRVQMDPGEIWYCDFTRPHYVKNTGREARIHLVLDLVVNDWLRQQFLGEDFS